MGNRRTTRRSIATAVCILASVLVHLSVLWWLALSHDFSVQSAKAPMRVTLRRPQPAPRPPAPPQPIAEPPARRPAPAARPQKRPAPVRRPPVHAAPDKAPPEAVPAEEPQPAQPANPPAAQAAQVGPPAAKGLALRMNWSAFRVAMGAQADADAQAFENKLEARRGGGVRFGALSPKTAAALRNHHSWIAGAPKLPAGTNKHVFRTYLEATHDRIHSYFADSFLPSLISLGASHPLNDMTLNALLEFRIAPDGTVEEIHVLRTSGQAVFDAAAVDALYRASPFLPPPEEIRSYDGRVYFRWGFYRNQRKCGTFNATGYILTGPAATGVPIESYPSVDG